MADHEVRDLKRKLKLANKQMGKQGETIYELRNEVAALRAKLKYERAVNAFGYPDGGDVAAAVAEHIKQTVPPSRIEGLA